MWLHPITAKQIRILTEDWGVKDATDGNGNGSATVDGEAATAAVDNSGWFEVLRPQQKTLACGDIGDGAMKEWTEVARIIQARLGLEPPAPVSTS